MSDSLCHPDNIVTCNTIQYNWALIVNIALLTLKFRSAITRLGGADAILLQNIWVQRTCSRFLHSNCLGRGSNSYSPCYRPSALTDRPLCHNKPLVGWMISTWHITGASVPRCVVSCLATRYWSGWSQLSVRWEPVIPSLIRVLYKLSDVWEVGLLVVDLGSRSFYLDQCAVVNTMWKDQGRINHVRIGNQVFT